MLYNWLQHIEFKNLWVLPLLLSLPVVAWFYYRTPSWRKSTFKVTTAESFKVRTAKNNLLHLPFWLRLFALGCLILALARPQVKNVQNKTKGEGIDIVLCMDVSGSMLSNDFQPNRLEAAKQMASEFVRNRPIDQIGLVIFSGESFTQFPVSTDHEGLLEQINGLRSGMLIDGTVIGEGLATSVERLASSKAKSRIIILLTDGNEQPPETRLIDPITALEIARTKAVKVYTIGMGAIGMTTVQGRTKNDAFLDEGLLRKIATQTGGQYFRAIDRESLQNIYQQIDKLEKSDVQVVTRTKFEEQFMYLILAALFLLALDIILRFTYLRSFP
ncbi:MAG: vWA domain-containing protein [Flavisolibacter sp.]